MNALQEVIHSARELVNEHRHAYPPIWAKDANEIIDAAAAELAALHTRVGEAEMIVAWQAGDISEGRAAKMLNIDRLKLRTLRDEIRAAALAKGAK